VSFLVN